jgi:hypothetical protein
MWEKTARQDTALAASGNLDPNSVLFIHMRMTENQLNAIRAGAVKHFGSKAHLWLFGSRVDDEKKAATLHIEPGIRDAASLVEAKLNF